LSSVAIARKGNSPAGIFGRLMRWMDATPHPPLAFEISQDRIAAARFTRSGTVEGNAVEELPKGAVVPSAIEGNLANVAAVSSAVRNLCRTLGAENEEAALLLPDPVIRVFVHHFDDIPRTAQEAIPMLRWKLKKSVPFEVEETLLSYMKQTPKDDESGVDVVTAIARIRIIKDYEGLLENVGLRPGVVLSSSLAAISLLDDQKAALLARVSGTSLTTAIVHDGALAGYRCTELPAHAENLTPQMLLEEVYPVAAYYQDTFREGIESVRVAGLGARLPEFVQPLEAEFKCPVRSLLNAAVSDGNLRADARPLADQDLEGLVGWMLHRN
jgi:type IV pilus assembly protein PilM